MEPLTFYTISSIYRQPVAWELDDHEPGRLSWLIRRLLMLIHRRDAAVPAARQPHVSLNVLYREQE